MEDEYVSSNISTTLYHVDKDGNVAFDDFRKYYSLIIVVCHLVIYLTILAVVSCVAAKEIKSTMELNQSMKSADDTIDTLQESYDKQTHWKWRTRLGKWITSVNAKRRVYGSLLPYLFDQAVKRAYFFCFLLFLSLVLLSAFHFGSSFVFIVMLD